MRKPALWTTIPSSLKPRTLKRQPKPAKPPRKRIKAQSKRGKSRMAAYKELRAAWLLLDGHRYCEACWQIEWNYPRPATDVHHLRGRAGSLLLNRRYWLAVCRPCHQWIGANPAKAREYRLIAPVGQWNKP